jgi:uncharacterized protein YoxC
METAAEILVIILSAFLAFFLLLGVILTIYLINISRKIRKITDAAEKTVNNIEHTVSGVTKAISPMFVAGIVKKYLYKLKKEEDR